MRKRQRRSLEFYLKLMRHPGTPESVGRGVAAGFCSAFILPVGHMVAAFFLAMLVRGARGAAVLSTWIINPLTIPFIWPVQCYLGSFIIGKPLSFELIKRLVSDAIHQRSVAAAGELSGRLLASFFAGGVLLGTVAAAAGYFFTTKLVKRHRERHAERKKLRKSRWMNKEC